MSDAAWKDVTLGDLVEANPETLGSSTPTNWRFRYIDITSVTPGKVNWETVPEYEYRLAPSRARRVVRPGDTLFCTVRPSLQAHANADWTQREGIVCSTGFAVLRPGEADRRFIFHTVFSEAVTSHVRRREVGSSYPAVNESDLKLTPLSVPDQESERSRIAEILDTWDVAIRETEAVVAKLRQLKAGLLYDLLTRGLDEQGELRDPSRHPEQFQDSDLGRIPKTWATAPLLSPLSFVMDYRGRTPKKLGMKWGGDIPALSAKNVCHGGIDLTRETYYGSDALYARWMTNGDMQLNDVLLTLEAPLGNVAWIPDSRRYILSQRVVLLRPDEEQLDPVFLRYQLMTERFQRALVRDSTGTTATGIQRAKLEKVPILVPDSVDEQKQIAAKLLNADERIVAEESQLLKLQSIKRGLAHDLLTGATRVIPQL
jgi:type I restriction enzyme, S subunit